MQDTARQAAGLGSTFKRLVSVASFDYLAQRALAYGRVVIGLVDEYSRLQNQLKLVTTGSENLARVQDELYQLAQETRSPLEATATLYARIARNAGDLGLSQQEILGVTKAVNQAIQVSGGTATEASAGVIQFAQALASGVLRGDELRSMMENMPRLSQGLAQGLGVSIGELRELGEAGQLTSEKVIKALQKSAPDIAKEFAKLTPTIGSAFTTLRNSIVVTFGELSKASGIGDTFAKWVIEASTLISHFARALTGTLEPTDEVAAGMKLFASAVLIAYSVVEPFVKAITGTFATAFKSIGQLLGGFAATMVAFFSGDFKRAGVIAGETMADFDRNISEGLAETSESIIGGMSKRIESLVKIWDEGARAAEPAQGRLLNPGAATKKTISQEIEEYKVVNATKIEESPTARLNRELIDATKTADEKSLQTFHETSEALRDLLAQRLIDETQYQERRGAALDELLPEIEVKVKRIATKTVATFDPLMEFAKQAARNIQDTFAEFLFNPFEEGLDGMLRGFLTMMQRIAAEAAAARALKELAGMLSASGNPYLKAVGGVFSGRAEGGSVQKGVPYAVNERDYHGRRPEIFVPPKSGRIMDSGKASAAAAPMEAPANIFVRSEEEIPNAIASRRGRGAVVTLLSTYPGEFRRALGI